MQVIATGLGRTGTTSLEVALVRLGFGPCFSAGAIFDRTELIRPLLRIIEDDSAPWEGILTGYASLLGEPASVCWRRLVRCYPEAKVVHTVRDPERWLDSIRKTLYERRRRVDSLPGKAAVLLSSMFGTDLAPLVRLFQVTYEAKALRFLAEQTPQRAVELFEEHTAQIRETVPADRLLVLDVRDGWKPLCAFLEVPVPDEPFPRVNDTAEYSSSRGGFGGRALPLLLGRTRPCT
ncbi:sulfotransferase family protein [Nonomuraea sp. ATR24]|uniref:sulfotransferase family protein n=1 Tax=Nonomuraea TaxID=83681 RepID=UPI001C5FE21D|nr:sulfotransferase family protein [Nonomuraea ceibae]